jgi:hypothetical protein
MCSAIDADDTEPRPTITDDDSDAEFRDDDTVSEATSEAELL